MKINDSIKVADLKNKVNSKASLTIQNVEPEKKSSVGKYVLGGLGATAAVAIALLALKKGNAPKTLQEFKQAGSKFTKGKAILKNGKLYTGAIETIKKDGSKVIMTYENGVLKTAQQFKPTTNGHYLPSSMKQYNYAENGKLESVTDKIWAHVSHIDPKKHGFQWVERKTNNLDEMRKTGLENFKQKQAKQEEIRQIMSEFETPSIDKTNKYLDNNKRSQAYLEKMERMQERTAQSKEKVKQLEQKLNGNMQVNVEPWNLYSQRDTDYIRLRSTYRRAEEESVKQFEQIKGALHNKPQINASTIDKQYEISDELKAINERFAQLEKNPTLEPVFQDVKKIKEEAQAVRTYFNAPNGSVHFDRKTGEFIIRDKNHDSIVTLPKGKLPIKGSDEYYNLVNGYKRAIALGDTSRLSNNGSISFVSENGLTKKIITNNPYDESYKLFKKNQKGKYVLQTRVKKNSYCQDPSYGRFWKDKVVKHGEDGMTYVTYSDSQQTLEIVRDKKGNILKSVLIDNNLFKSPVEPPHVHLV